MDETEPKNELALDELMQELALVEKSRKKLFAAIIRFVRRCEASGPAKDMMAQIRRDRRLCQLLVDYEQDSEIVGMLDFVRDYKK